MVFKISRSCGQHQGRLGGNKTHKMEIGKEGKRNSIIIITKMSSTFGKHKSCFCLRWQFYPCL